MHPSHQYLNTPLLRNSAFAKLLSKNVVHAAYYCCPNMPLLSAPFSHGTRKKSLEPFVENPRVTIWQLALRLLDDYRKIGHSLGLAYGV